MLPRQPLWNFLKAGFPRARYCIASVTLTDAYVKDILSNDGDFHMFFSPNDHRFLDDIEGDDYLFQTIHQAQYLPAGRFLFLTTGGSPFMKIRLIIHLR